MSFSTALFRNTDEEITCLRDERSYNKSVLIDRLLQDDLFRSVPDAVHSSDPCHLVGSLERLCHTLLLCHLLHDQFHALLAGLVDLGQMLIQFASYKQIGVQHRPMLFQIALAHPTMLADGPLLSFVNCQIGEKVISDLAVSAAVTFEKGLVCMALLA